MTSAMDASSVQPLLSRQDAARFLNVSLRTLDRMCIPRIKLGHSVRYRMEALNDYLDECVETQIKQAIIKKQTSRAILSGRSNKKSNSADWKAKKLAQLRAA